MFCYKQCLKKRAKNNKVYADKAFCFGKFYEILPCYERNVKIGKSFF